MAGTALDFYFYRSKTDNGPTNEAKAYVKVKGVMLEKFSVGKTESEIIEEALFLGVERSYIQTSLTTADKSYSQAKFSEQAKFGIL